MERRGHGPIERRVEQAVERGRRLVVLAVLVMMIVAVLVAAGDVAWVLARALVHPHAFTSDRLLDLFGLLLLVLVGVELIETVHGALDRPAVAQAKTVLLAGLVATARSVILLKTEGASLEKLAGYGVLIVALALAVMLLRVGRRPLTR